MFVLIGGCGWLGMEVARELIGHGHRVVGVRRRWEGVDGPFPSGLERIVLDLADPDAVERLPDAIDAIVSCAGAAAPTVAAYRHAYLDLNRVLLSYARRSPLRAFVYTSSTGVFGQQDGEDVDEETIPEPSEPTAEVLLEAEKALIGDEAVRIVRLSGLYGPGRYGVVDRVRAGKLSLGPGDDAWMNWCHRYDAARVVVAALERGRPGAVYHGSDAHPTRRRDVVVWIADRLGIEPPLEDPGTVGVPRGRRGANRRVLSVRTREELVVSLRFPSFRDGLLEVLEAQRG